MGDGQVRNNDCATRVRVKLYADTVVCCSVLILLFKCAQCVLSIEGMTGEEDSRWLRRHATKKTVIAFACNVIAGKTTNPSNWPYFCLGLFFVSTRCNHWYKHCFGHVQFRHHWFAQLPWPWFTLSNCVIIAYMITRGVRSARRMRIDANAHESVNAWIHIECALQVLCEQDLRFRLHLSWR